MSWLAQLIWWTRVLHSMVSCFHSVLCLQLAYQSESMLTQQQYGFGEFFFFFFSLRLLILFNKFLDCCCSSTMLEIFVVQVSYRSSKRMELNSCVFFGMEIYFNLNSYGNENNRLFLARDLQFQILGAEALIISGYEDIKISTYH